MRERPGPGLARRAGVVGAPREGAAALAAPLGVDCTRLAMDTAVAAYLLDPSTGDYGARRGGLAGAGRSRGPAASRPGSWPWREAADDVDAGRPAAGRGGHRGPAGRAAAGRASTPRDWRPARRGRAAAWCGCWPGWRWPGSGWTPPSCAGSPTSWWPTRGRLEAEIHRLAGHEFNVNSTPQLRTVLYDELGLTPGRKTKTGYSTDATTLESPARRPPGGRRPCSATARWRSSARPTARACWPRWRPTAASTPRSARRWPAPAGCPRTAPTCTTSRCAPRPAGASAGPSSRPRAAASWWPTTTRSSCGSSPTSRGTPAWSRPSPRAPTSTGRWPPGSTACRPSEVTPTQRERAKMVSYGLAYGMEAFGLARRLSTGVDEASEIMARYFGPSPRCGPTWRPRWPRPGPGAHPDRAWAASGPCPSWPTGTAPSGWRPSARP